VIVESAKKARQIQQHLGSAYQVLACFGHVRDLPSSKEKAPEPYASQPWASLGIDVENDFRPVYIVPSSKKDKVKELQQAASRAGHVLLATDDDREGESISWHLTKVLGLKETQYDRMVFHEITAEAIQKAVKQLRRIDFALVGAQEARRTLDRLVGYGVSPKLWNAIGGPQSAGRVQSVTLGILANIEHRRMQFVSAGYWRLSATCQTAQGETFPAQVTRYKDKEGRMQPLAKPKSYDAQGTVIDGSRVLTAEEAGKLKAYLEGRPATIKAVTVKPYTTTPPAPFHTSTLQQAASVRLKLDPQDTMKYAQELYDSGFITYMRTDSPSLSTEAMAAARAIAVQEFGPAAVPPSPRLYASKSASAQEAHEAIRPSGTTFRLPQSTDLSGPQLALYTLIFRRTVASQMSDLKGLKTEVDLLCGPVGLWATGQQVLDPGFTRVYAAEASESGTLPSSLAAEQQVRLQDVKAEERQTPAPGRFTQASIIQEMERLGVGRPATFASTITTLADRGYTAVHDRKLHVTLLGLMVHRYLQQELPMLLDPAFTSRMEDDLDKISQKELNRTAYLNNTWNELLAPQIGQSSRRPPSIDLGGTGVTLNVRPGGGFRDPPVLHLKRGQQQVVLPTGLLPEQLTPDNVQRLLAGEQVKLKTSRAPKEAGASGPGKPAATRSKRPSTPKAGGSKAAPAKKRATAGGSGTKPPRGGKAS